MGPSHQELSIRANKFIEFFTKEMSSTPLSVARPEGEDYPEVTVIHGETRSFVRLEFRPSAIRSDSETYMIDGEADDKLFSEIIDDVESELVDG